MLINEFRHWPLEKFQHQTALRSIPYWTNLKHASDSYFLQLALPSGRLDPLGVEHLFAVFDWSYLLTGSQHLTRSFVGAKGVYGVSPEQVCVRIVQRHGRGSDAKWVEHDVWPKKGWGFQVNTHGGGNSRAMRQHRSQERGKGRFLMPDVKRPGRVFYHGTANVELWGIVGSFGYPPDPHMARQCAQILEDHFLLAR